MNWQVGHLSKGKLVHQHPVFFVALVGHLHTLLGTPVGQVRSRRHFLSGVFFSLFLSMAEKKKLDSLIAMTRKSRKKMSDERNAVVCSRKLPWGPSLGIIDVFTWSGH